MDVGAAVLVKDQSKTAETPARCSGLDRRCARRRLVEETADECRRKLVVWVAEVSEA